MVGLRVLRGFPSKAKSANNHSQVVTVAYFGFSRVSGNVTEDVYVPSSETGFGMKGGNSYRALQGGTTNTENATLLQRLKMMTKISEMCSKRRCICKIFMGGLGNLMFQYASLIGIAHMKDMIPVIPKGSYLPGVFKLNITTVSEEVCVSFLHHGDLRACAFDEGSMAFSNQTADYTLYGYFQSWRYFENVARELKQQLMFRDEILEKAKRILWLSTARLRRNRNATNITFVGIHIRRGDITTEHNMHYGYRVAPKKYFIHAMQLFRKKINPIRFIICTNDKTWSEANIPQTDDVIISSNEPEVDLATLALCNHTIMSVGTFSWWAAWLAGGTSVYYKYPFEQNSELATQTNLSDYIYPNWIGME